VVLFGQPEIDLKLDQVGLRQLKQRITFSYYLQPLSRYDLEKYLSHRLARAGYTYGCIFTQEAQKRLYQASQGLPRILNILCHKALLVAYGQGKFKVDGRAVKRAIADTDSTTGGARYSSLVPYLGVGALGLSILFMLYWTYGLSL
jgi:MSHA biogenesis protein MshM